MHGLLNLGAPNLNQQENKVKRNGFGPGGITQDRLGPTMQCMRWEKEASGITWLELSHRERRTSLRVPGTSFQIAGRERARM